MSDVGKAIYLACSALLFIFAATTSIYLYTTLNTYLDNATGLTSVYDRAEGQSLTVVTSKREITLAEIYITVTNMEQMHVSKVTVKDVCEFNLTDTEDEITEKIKNKLDRTYTIGHKFEYSVTTNADGSKEVTYKNI